MLWHWKCLVRLYLFLLLYQKDTCYCSSYFCTMSTGWKRNPLLHFVWVENFCLKSNCSKDALNIRNYICVSFLVMHSCNIILSMKLLAYYFYFLKSIYQYVDYDPSLCHEVTSGIRAEQPRNLLTFWEVKSTGEFSCT